VADLNALSDFRGPKPVTPDNIFRGSAAGALVGPFVAQFFYTNVVVRRLFVALCFAQTFVLSSLAPIRLTCA
jgi:hypothetical protein